MVQIEKLSIKNNGITLESELFQSISHEEESVVLICHPHPQYGGNMFNNVVSGVINALIKNDISCLRFNFRGVGRSTGTHTDGTGELSDVHACIDFLINERKFGKIFLCGYSYGAAIGCSAVGYSDKIAGYISVSFPWDFMGSKFKELAQSSKPKLFIQGDQDTVAHYGNFQENFDYYLTPKKMKIIKGADHFYGNFEEQVANAVLEFLREL